MSGVAADMANSARLTRLLGMEAPVRHRLLRERGVGFQEGILPHHLTD